MGRWPNSQLRYKLRPRTSGCLNSEDLWADGNKQDTLGWLAPPLPIDLEESVATCVKGSADSAFRLGVDQADKLRGCDGLNSNAVGLFRIVWTPVKLPTLGHIAQMRLSARLRRGIGDSLKPTTMRHTNNYR